MMIQCSVRRYEFVSKLAEVGPDPSRLSAIFFSKAQVAKEAGDESKIDQQIDSDSSKSGLQYLL